MFLGIDFGTSGCRACIINQQDEIVFEHHLSLSLPTIHNNIISQSPDIWWLALLDLFKEIQHKKLTHQITSICINGTSATLIHCLKNGDFLNDALMYNDTSSSVQLGTILQFAPKDHVTLNSSSALSKMMSLYQLNPIPDSIMLNQADWLSNKLINHFGFSDYNNALKMGYDIQQLTWPKWIKNCIPTSVLPKVLAPGDTIGLITKDIAEQFGFNDTTQIKLGTTDSIAAFIATGVHNKHHAVTSLGSTLVLKILSDKPIENSRFGIYSHKLGQYCLAGGASNSGGAALAQFFNQDQLENLSRKININELSLLNYYPLPQTGERFPINDPLKTSITTPRPVQDEHFLQGLFEGIARIEQLGYQKLAALGAQYPSHIMTCGGGSKNKHWTQIRQAITGAKVRNATFSEACYGSALLAKHGLKFYL